MRTKTFVVFPILLISLLLACNNNSDANNLEGDDGETPSNLITLNIDRDETFQTIDNFGASDAWSTQFVGNWPQSKKEKIADLLFSREKDEQGNPLGIGLSLWRFNIGAGSAEQGENSGIGDEWRRVEGFLNDNGSYDWEKQSGQVWFAHAAKARGVENLLLFSNSPPVEMTRTGKAYAENENTNIAPENYSKFAGFLSNVIKGLQEKGLDPNYISPINEPQWDWSDGGQEGTPFRNNEIHGLVNELNKKLEEENLDVKIDIPETAQLNYLYEKDNKPQRGEQIKSFFDKSSENYVGDFSKISNTISGHSYFTTYPYSEVKEIRNKVKNEIDNYDNLKFWMSEYCILENNEIMEGNGRDLGIDPALYVAGIIHADLSIANATAWHWWLAVSPYNYKDGLVYIDHQKHDGNFYESKILWGLGNYSHFIKPGFQRVQITAPNNTKADTFLYSAYKNPNNDEVVIVLVNKNNEEINLNLKAGDESLQNIKAFITSSEKNLEVKTIDSEVNIPPKSIVTITTNLN